MGVPHHFDYCSFRVSFAFRKCKSSYFVLFKESLAILGHLYFHICFSCSFVVFCKKASWNFDSYCNESVQFRDSIAILTKLNLLFMNMGCLSIYLDLLFSDSVS